jgi:hypothetical protein
MGHIPPPRDPDEDDDDEDEDEGSDTEPDEPAVIREPEENDRSIGPASAVRCGIGPSRCLGLVPISPVLETNSWRNTRTPPA